MPRFFIQKQNISDTAVSITGSDAKHIRNVLRMKTGDKLVLFDGDGYDYDAEITSVSSDNIEAAIYGQYPSKTESKLNLWVAQAYLKDKKMDDAVRQVTELGVIQWVPFMAGRSVPKPDSRRLKARWKRWENIAHESLKQCGRTKIPEISALKTFKEVLHLGSACDVKIVFWENETNTLKSKQRFAQKDSIRSVMIMLGPEGGFTQEEITDATDSGFVTMGLGPRILKADTATVAACSLIQYLFGDMG